MRLEIPESMPDGIKDIVHGFGEDREKLFYQKDNGQFLSQEDARDEGVTHSTTPQPSPQPSSERYHNINDRTPPHPEERYPNMNETPHPGSNLRYRDDDD